MAQQNEASVEEILESIKKVIARDNRSANLQPRRPLAEVSEPDEIDPANEDEAIEILDLSEMQFAEDEEEAAACGLAGCRLPTPAALGNGG